MLKNMANILHKPSLRITIKNAGNRHARRKRPVKPLPAIRFTFRRPESHITMWHNPPLFFQTIPASNYFMKYLKNIALKGKAPCKNFYPDC